MRTEWSVARVGAASRGASAAPVAGARAGSRGRLDGVVVTGREYTGVETGGAYV